MKFLAVFLALFGTIAHAGDDTLVLYNWAEYMPQEVLERFTAETGIRVIYSTYDTNEAMYAKIKTVRGEGYDLLVPSTYYVDRMRREGLLQKIDTSRLTNFRHLDPRLLHGQHDPDNAYSVPYLWGTTGIAVNADAVDPATVSAWADLWDPRFAGRLLLLDDVREVFSMALKTLGYSANSTDAGQIEEAYEKLTQLLPNVRVFNADSPKALYLAEEVVAGMNWNGEAYLASQENPALHYLYPKEGAIIWMDSFVIPQGAANVDAAHRFIDFVLRPEIGKQISEEIGYATPNLAAVALLPDGLRNNRIVYPSDEDLRNAEFQTSVGEALSVYQRYWQRLKAGR
ncbi:MAG: extracellular solute-binding protein [Pseudomonadota bacterium]|nr:extracellular solute-binding protein [Pseudomonadota bacterium]